MQVDVTIRVLKEGVVEVLGREGTAKALGCPPQLAPQIRPFLLRQRRDVLDVAAKDDDQLAEEILVAVERDPPVGGLVEDRREERAAERARQTQRRLAASAC